MTSAYKMSSESSKGLERFSECKKS